MLVSLDGSLEKPHATCKVAFERHGHAEERIAADPVVVEVVGQGALQVVAKQSGSTFADVVAHDFADALIWNPTSRSNGVSASAMH